MEIIGAALLLSGLSCLCTTPQTVSSACKHLWDAEFDLCFAALRGPGTGGLVGWREWVRSWTKPVERSLTCLGLALTPTVSASQERRMLAEGFCFFQLWAPRVCLWMSNCIEENFRQSIQLAWKFRCEHLVIRLFTQVRGEKKENQYYVHKVNAFVLLSVACSRCSKDIALCRECPSTDRRERCPGCIKTFVKAVSFVF